jgi:beta-glucosidase
MTRFPDGFLWGVATSGHQNEGDDVTSDMSFLESRSPSVFREPSGRACNSWELWETDLDLVAGLGLDAYRFSVEWARIEPVEGGFDDEALAHYEAVVDGCLARGLAPIVTFIHFTAPHWFASRGAWLDPEAAEFFARFVGVVMDRFGDRIAYALTINEPDLPEMLTWAGLPPGIADLERQTLQVASADAGVERYRSSNVMLPEDFAGMRAGMTAAHRAAKAAIKARRPELPVGLGLAMCDDVAIPGAESVRDRKRHEVYDHWLDLAHDDDFIGVQNYERLTYGPDGTLVLPPGAMLNDMATPVDASSLRGAVEYAYALSGVPVLVTEHGISTPDDRIRARFIGPSLEGLADAIQAGVPVLGYCHWTLVDNFDWIFGFAPRVGLYGLDRQTFARIPKPSAAVYADIVRAARAGQTAERFAGVLG